MDCFEYLRSCNLQKRVSAFLPFFYLTQFFSSLIRRFVFIYQFVPAWTRSRQWIDLQTPAWNFYSGQTYSCPRDPTASLHHTRHPLRPLEPLTRISQQYGTDRF